ncbi:hypothetical protein A4H97_10235 [Niastella yeongjuensis]|uniref:Uncharacterized protein n=1 Tax=Niastella yeongjuensis TaxID=354355 RepID=A0A1V9EF88_9BACT|nr:hypothetical protein [Niastella yeongjuensis]OQP44732.1 hypothetical protein A4H97_10235 [Niastella yeongjuensis]
MEDNYFIPLFKENDRTNVLVYRSVKYSKIPVGIPRCRSCKEIHDAAHRKAAFIAWGTALAIVAVSFLIGSAGGVGGIFIGLMIGLFAGFMTGTIMVDKLQVKIVNRYGILSKLTGAHHNDAVQDLVINGWSFSQPTA